MAAAVVMLATGEELGGASEWSTVFAGSESDDKVKWKRSG